LVAENCDGILKGSFAMAPSRVPSNPVDHVGSLKRPADLVAAWRGWESGEIDSGNLREVQDRAIRDVIRMQEDLDLPIVTDGEFRRAAWSRGFLNAVEGFDFASSKLVFRSDDGFTTASPAPFAATKVRRASTIVVDDFKFISGVASRN
jgi:5-methyltetrahydropteroyltriglutamate--homocysteine methyltransferase